MKDPLSESFQVIDSLPLEIPMGFISAPYVSKDLESKLHVWMLVDVILKDHYFLALVTELTTSVEIARYPCLVERFPEFATELTIALHSIPLPEHCAGFATIVKHDIYWLG